MSQSLHPRDKRASSTSANTSTDLVVMSPTRTPWKIASSVTLGPRTNSYSSTRTFTLATTGAILGLCGYTLDSTYVTHLHPDPQPAQFMFTSTGICCLRFDIHLPYSWTCYSFLSQTLISALQNRATPQLLHHPLACTGLVIDINLTKKDCN